MFYLFSLCVFMFYICCRVKCESRAPDDADVYVFKHKNVYLSDRGLIIIGSFMDITPPK